MRYPPQFSLNVLCSYYLIQRGPDKVCMSTDPELGWAFSLAMYMSESIYLFQNDI